MDRKSFLNLIGLSAASAIIAPVCIGGFASCTKTDVAPANVDFTLDVSSGSLAKNGGYLVQNGVIVARTVSGSFIAVSASCTHEGTNVYYATNQFICPNHGARFSESGVVSTGPASTNLHQYKTTLAGNSLRVYS